MELQIFSNSEFGEIRTITKDDEPMFCLADVCKALEISNVGNVKQRLSEKGIHTADTLTKGGMQKMIFISEANLSEPQRKCREIYRLGYRRGTSVNQKNRRLWYAKDNRRSDTAFGTGLYRT